MKTIFTAVIFLLAATVLVTPAHATDAACASPQALNSGMGTGGGNGCSYINANFVNFQGSAPSGLGDGTFPVLTSGFTPNIELTASGAQSNYSLAFTTTGQTIDLCPSCTGPACIANSWCAPENSTTALQNVSYAALATGGQHFYNLSLTDGTLSAHTLVLGNVVTVTESFCLGSATFNCVQGNSNFGYVKIQATTDNATGTYTTVYSICTPGSSGCTSSNTASASINFGGQLQIGIQDSVTMTTVTGQEMVFLDSFNNNFSETSPEPSTFVLLGTALAGVGLLRARRKNA